MNPFFVRMIGDKVYGEFFATAEEAIEAAEVAHASGKYEHVAAGEEVFGSIFWRNGEPVSEEE